MLAQLGFIPRGGVRASTTGDISFTVLEMDRRRVARVKVQRLKQPGEPAVSASASETSHVAGNARKTE